MKSNTFYIRCSTFVVNTLLNTLSKATSVKYLTLKLCIPNFTLSRSSVHLYIPCQMIRFEKKILKFYVNQCIEEQFRLLSGFLTSYI